MNTELTEIAVVLDRSGSMEAMRLEAQNGFNHFLESQKKLPGDVRLTLVLFDHEYLIEHNGVPVAEICPLNERTYVPRGTTALLDAVGRTINTIGERLAKTPESDRPAKVLIVILTDGLENASQEFKRPQILEMIKRQREVYGWEFLFLGANQDAIQAGSAIGIAPACSVTFDEAPGGMAAAFTAIACASAAYRAGEEDYADHLKKAAKKGKV